jgi:predicted transcriptional regulator
MDDIRDRAIAAIEMFPEEMREHVISHIAEQAEKLRTLRELVAEGLADVEAGRLVDWDPDAFLAEMKARYDDPQ